MAISDKESIDALHETIKSAIAATNSSEVTMRRLTWVGLVVAIVGAVLAAIQAYAAFSPNPVQCTQLQPVANASKQ